MERSPGFEVGGVGCGGVSVTSCSRVRLCGFGRSTERIGRYGVLVLVEVDCRSGNGYSCYYGRCGVLSVMGCGGILVMDGYFRLAVLVLLQEGSEVG